MACDICNKKGTELEPLLSIYQTVEIKSVCPDCLKVINKQLSKIKHVNANITQSLFKRFMEVLRSKGQP